MLECSSIKEVVVPGPWQDVEDHRGQWRYQDFSSLAMQTWNPSTRTRAQGQPGLQSEWRKQAPRGSWASFWAAWLPSPGILLEASLRPPLALNILKDQHRPRAQSVCLASAFPPSFGWHMPDAHLKLQL